MSGSITPRGVPQTPPASTHKGHATKPIPKFHLPEETPKSLTKAGHVQLQTPATTRRKSILLTPHTNLDSSKGLALFQPSPDFTPQKSPRLKRKKLTFDSILPLTETISLLLPNPASAGSGRKHGEANFGVLKPHAPIDMSELFELNSNLEFEEDIPESPSKRGRPRKPKAQTPGKQLITEEKIKSWHGKSFNSGFSSDEEDFDSVLHTSTKPVNPFIDSSLPAKQKELGSAAFSKKRNPFASDSGKVDYATHMEYINHRTGEKKVVLLLEEQRQFKPRKLDFSGI